MRYWNFVCDQKGSLGLNIFSEKGSIGVQTKFNLHHLEFVPVGKEKLISFVSTKAFKTFRHPSSKICKWCNGCMAVHNGGFGIFLGIVSED